MGSMEIHLWQRFNVCVRFLSLNIHDRLVHSVILGRSKLGDFASESNAYVRRTCVEAASVLIGCTGISSVIFQYSFTVGA